MWCRIIPKVLYLPDISYPLTALEFPAIAIVLVLLFTTGRRVAILSLYICCGLSLMFTMAIPS